MTKVNKAISNINQTQMHWHDIGAKDLRSMTKISVVRSLWPIFTIFNQIIETQTDRMIKTRNGNDENPKQELETDEAELAGAHFLSFLQRMLVAHTA